MSDSFQTEVMEIIENALELSKGILKDDSSSETIEEWDSLGQLSILVALDKNFDGRVSTISEMAEADSVTKIINTLKDNSIF